MAKERKFYLDDEKTQEITVTWRGIWKDVVVSHNEQFLGSFPDMRALKHGNNYRLNDGSSLVVYLSTDRDSPGLRIEHNGRPIKGTVASPGEKLSGIFAVACIVGGINVICGALGEFEISEMMMEMGANWILMVTGIAIVILGWITWKKISYPALTGIILIIAADIALTLFYALESEGNFPITGVGLKVIFMINFARGYKYIREHYDQQIMERNSMQVPVRKD